MSDGMSVFGPFLNVYYSRFFQKLKHTNVFWESLSFCCRIVKSTIFVFLSNVEPIEQVWSWVLQFGEFHSLMWRGVILGILCSKLAKAILLHRLTCIKRLMTG